MKQRVVGFVILILVLVVVGIIFFTGSKKGESDQSQVQTTDQTNNAPASDNTNQPPMDQGQPGDQQQPTDDQTNQQGQQPYPSEQSPQSVPNSNPNGNPTDSQVGSETEPTPTPETMPANPEQQQPVATTSEQVPAKAATTATQHKATKHKATNTKKPTVSHGDWTVQAASFSSSTNAKKLQKQLTKKGYSAYVKPVKTASGKTMYRVDVGHGITKAEAKKVIAQLKTSAHLEGIIIKYKK
jgi:DedD protein